MPAAKSKSINPWAAFDGLPVKPKQVHIPVTFDPLATAEQIRALRKKRSCERTKRWCDKNRAIKNAKETLRQLMYPEKYRPIRKRGYEKNRAERCRKSREWYWKNRDRIRGVKRKYYLANRKYIILKSKIWITRKKLEAAA